jgi:hypothetical protein
LRFAGLLGRYYVLERRAAENQPVSVPSLNLVIFSCTELGDVGRAIECDTPPLAVPLHRPRKARPFHASALLR